LIRFALTGQADRLERRPCALMTLLIRLTERGIQHRQLDVIDRRRLRQQVETLKDEPDPLVANPRQLVGRQRQDLAALEQVLAGGRVRQTAEDVQERRFAGPGRAVIETNSPAVTSSDTPSKARTSTSSDR
jgi:hypothetical protein